MAHTNKVVKKHNVKFRVKTGDKVRVISGNEKGKEGIIVKVDKEKQRVFIEGLNLVKKAVKPSQAKPEGGFIEKEASIHISNVMLIDPKTGEPTRVGRRRNATTGKLERYTKKSNTVV